MSDKPIVANEAPMTGGQGVLASVMPALRLPAAVAALLLAGGSARAADAFLNVTPINNGWKFLRLDTPTDAGTPALGDTSEAEWKTVSLPHTAHIEPLVATAGDPQIAAFHAVEVAAEFTDCW